MTSIQDMREDGEAMVSPLDLKQIRDAVSALRASHRSVLGRSGRGEAPQDRERGPADIAVPQAPEWRLSGKRERHRWPVSAIKE